jgi:hypothetical protein
MANVNKTSSELYSKVFHLPLYDREIYVMKIIGSYFDILDLCCNELLKKSFSPLSHFAFHEATAI